MRFLHEFPKSNMCDDVAFAADHLTTIVLLCCITLLYRREGILSGSRATVRYGDS